ncbi:nucleotide exchange factor GrpE [Gemella sanguinis]|mgnify:FL=1
MATEEKNENIEEVVEETVENQETTETEEEVVEEKTAEELLQEKVDKLEEELKQSEDKYLRLYAEFENFKRRKNKEIETNNVYKSQKVITEILPSLDNLERALQVESDNEEIKSLLKGVEMVYEGLLNVLKSEGVELIETENAQFDPNYHHAVMQEEDSEKESGAILDTFQKGYKLKDRVIRPAMVKVNS